MQFLTVFSVSGDGLDTNCVNTMPIRNAWIVYMGKDHMQSEAMCGKNKQNRVLHTCSKLAFIIINK